MRLYYQLYAISFESWEKMDKLHSYHNRLKEIQRPE